jgi:hypothetical protein
VAGRVKAKQKWLMIIVDIVHWELTCEPGELLSAECDRWIVKHPVLARLLIIAVGAQVTLHLANAIPSPAKHDLMSTDFWSRFKS